MPKPKAAKKMRPGNTEPVTITTTPERKRKVNQALNLAGEDLGRRLSVSEGYAAAMDLILEIPSLFQSWIKKMNG